MAIQKNDFKDVCKGMKILVVDDLKPSLDLMKGYFEILGCEGDYAKNGLEAVNKIKANQYDLCLMDFQMPVMGGIEATKIIRQQLKSTMPIIALTGSATVEDFKEGLASGMNSCCTKPVKLAELAWAILSYKVD